MPGEGVMLGTWAWVCPGDLGVPKDVRVPKDMCVLGGTCVCPRTRVPGDMGVGVPGDTCAWGTWCVLEDTCTGDVDMCVPG